MVTSPQTRQQAQERKWAIDRVIAASEHAKIEVGTLDQLLASADAISAYTADPCAGLHTLIDSIAEQVETAAKSDKGFAILALRDAIDGFRAALEKLYAEKQDQDAMRALAAEVANDMQVQLTSDTPVSQEVLDA